jgi:hypothetical protein
MNIHQRLAAVMRDVTYIQKEKKQGMRYSIVSHDAVTAKVRPALLQNGVIYYPMHLNMNQAGNRTECTMIVRFANIDEPDDCIDVASAGYGIDDQDKGPGKAISYAVKYALLKALGLESGDDPDEDQEVVHESTVMAALKMTIQMAATLKELDEEVAPQIKQNSAAMTPAQMQVLRSHFAKKKMELAKAAPTSAEQH